jgi:hypothetical protein
MDGDHHRLSLEGDLYSKTLHPILPIYPPPLSYLLFEQAKENSRTARYRRYTTSIGAPGGIRTHNLLLRRERVILSSI